MAFVVGSPLLMLVTPGSKALAVNRASDHLLSPYGQVCVICSVMSDSLQPHGP